MMGINVEEPKHRADSQSERGLKVSLVTVLWVIAAGVFQLTPWPGWSGAIAITTATTVVSVIFFYLGVRMNLTWIAFWVTLLLIVGSALCGWQESTQIVTTTQIYRVEVLGVLASGLGFATGVSRAGNSVFTRDGAVGLIALVISVAGTATLLANVTQPEQAHVTLMVDNAAPPGYSTLTYRVPGTTTDKTSTSLDGSFVLPLPYPDDGASFKTGSPVQCGSNMCWQERTLNTASQDSYSATRALKAFINVASLGTVRDDNILDIVWNANSTRAGKASTAN